jgi:hypothetical protein
MSTAGPYYIKEEVFRNNTTLTPHYFEKFKKNFLELDQNHKAEKSLGAWWGFKKGGNEGLWKWSDEDFELHSDLPDVLVNKLAYHGLKVNPFVPGGIYQKGLGL